MTTAYGDNYTKTLDPTVQSGMLSPGLFDGKVRVQVDVYEASALASGSTIYVAKLPKGAIWLGLSNMVTDDLGTAGTISAGIVGTVAKFLAATTTHTANLQTFMHAIDGLQYAFTAALPDVILTTAGASVSGTIKTEIYYARE
jgi:hypothetical protein